MNWRYKVLLFFLVFSFLLVIGRLFYWQVVKADELSILAESQYGKVIRLLPQRGEIKTSDGFPIVTNKTAYLVFGNPKEIKDQVATANTLAPVLQVDAASISSLLTLDKYWVPLKQKIDTQEKEEVKKLNLSGIGFE